jgi:hypothetical protein
LFSPHLEPEYLQRGCPLNNLSQEMSPRCGIRKRTANVFADWHNAIAVALRGGEKRGMVTGGDHVDEIHKTREK